MTSWRDHCLDCGARLTRDERAHYLYQCAGCALDEHDIAVAWRRGLDHPDIDRLLSGPVEIVMAVRPESRRDPDAAGLTETRPAGTRDRRVLAPSIAAAPRPRRAGDRAAGARRR